MQHLEYRIAVGSGLLLADALHFQQPGPGPWSSPHQLQQRPVVADHVRRLARGVRCLSAPRPQAVVRDSLTFVQLGQQLAEDVLLGLARRRILPPSRLLIGLLSAPQPAPGQAERPVRDPAMHEGEGVRRQDLASHSEIAQPLVWESLQQRVERQRQDRHFDAHDPQHRRKKSRALRPL
jgi:hypothetical protein